MISKVNNDSLLHVWNELLPQIEKAYKQGAGDSTTPDQVYESVKSGELEMWVVHEGSEVVAALLFAIKQYPAKKTIFIELVAGKNMKSWEGEMENKLREYKDLIGADTVEACSRKGVPRMLRHCKVKAYLVELV